MSHARYPWPLSEVESDEAATIVAMPPSLRDARINRLKADLKSGEHARRERLRQMGARTDAP